MLQVRAAHCPNCKEATPPGADHCPICGEDLTWKTTDGKNVPTQTVSSPKSSSLMNLFWIAIVFVAACLISMIFAMINLRSNPDLGKAKTPARTVIVQPTATPTAEATPLSEAESHAENAASGDQTTANSATPDGDASNTVTSPDSSDLSNLGVE